jgi:DHA1 family tetracycline resistance protein-like MFS transporter
VRRDSSTSLRRPAIAFIFVTGVLDVMAMGLVTPVLPSLVEEFAGSNTDAGWWNGVLMALWAAMQFVCSPIIGSLSDRYGRRPVILVSTLGLAADWALMALAPSLWWLALGRIIGGATSASFTVIFAYMADITEPAQRVRAYGLMGAAFSAGFIAGPMLGGLLGEFGARLPFWTACGLSAAAALYGWFILPESLPRERRMAFAWSRANPLGSLRLLAAHRELSGLAAVNLLLYFAHHVFSAVFVLYAAHRYGFGPFEVGLLLAFEGILETWVQAVLTERVVARLGDWRTMVLGLALGTIGLLLMGFAPSGWLFIAALVPNSLWALAQPTLLSLMTQRVSEREQGQLQGAVNSVASLAGVVSPLFFGWIYSVSTGDPGLTFYISAAILGLAALLGLVTGRRHIQPAR